MYRTILANDAFGGLVGDGASEPRRASIPTIVKHNSDASPYCVANEYICWEVARFLRLPVPPAGIVTAPKWVHKILFGSFVFGQTGDAPAFSFSDECVSAFPEVCAGILLYDVLIGNADRHLCNISADVETTPRVIHVFDHDRALFGAVAGQGCTRLRALQNSLGLAGQLGEVTQRHFLIDAIRTDQYFGMWMERARQLPPFLIEEVCREVRDLGLISVNEAAAAVEFLMYRSRELPRIIAANRSGFSDGMQWSLWQ